MQRLGIDIGTSAVKAVLIRENRIVKTIVRKHYGLVLQALRETVEEAAKSGETVLLGVTGSHASLLSARIPGLSDTGSIPAAIRGVREMVTEAGSIVDIGSQTSRFITNLDRKAPDFAVNEHCAGGTGSFFEDQMSRLGLKMEDYSALVQKAETVPRISGRCAVFAKTDIIHRQQEGVSTPDILAGLCQAMAQNYKSLIVGSLSVRKPVVFIGGVTQNAGMRRALCRVFSLQDEELIIPPQALFAGAIGAAMYASEPVETERLTAALAAFAEPMTCDADDAVRAMPYDSEQSEDKTCTAHAGNTVSRDAIRPDDKAGSADAGRALPPNSEHSEDQACSGPAGCAFPQDAAQPVLPKLRVEAGTGWQEPGCTGVLPQEDAALGIDIGSTSTNLVLMDTQGRLVDFQYLRTAGEPEAAVRKGLNKIRERFGEIRFLAVGITGSGRERLGRMMKADAIRDEITAQARAAAWWAPEADTVFEIGGQDSKYISLRNGEVADFQMNKICAAGTGSFVEEQAARMNIPIGDFGPLALTGEHPAELGERCTVFIETAIAAAQNRGESQADIAAGLCHSIVRNYLHKVVGNKPVGKCIVLQGGVAYNPGIIAAFQSAYPGAVKVSPVFPVSGAFGAALLAMETVGFRIGERDGVKCLEGEKLRASSFLGFDFPSRERAVGEDSAEIARNRALYNRAATLIFQGYDGTRDPRKKTVGIPLSLVMYKFFPLVNTFFRELGYNVLLSRTSNEEIIALSQQKAQGETCYPVKLMYGHMEKLAREGVDYIFMPNIHTIHHPHSGAAHNYACPYMQSAGKSVFDSLGLEARGIRLLNPVFDLDLGAAAMAGAMLGVGKALGFSKVRCAAALMKGSALVKQNGAEQKKTGKEVLASLKPGEKALVIVTRAYGIADPVLNMGIPQLLISRNCKVLTMEQLPADELDLNSDYPNMYWPFGEHILAAAKQIAAHPNLYAVYLTNHGCGPDSLLQHMFAEEMGEKPYLQIEVDEHFSPVGVVTRIEAFLNSLSHYHPESGDGGNTGKVRMRTPDIRKKPDPGKLLYIPDLGRYTPFLLNYFRACGYRAEAMEPFSREHLGLGRAETRAKEYLPFVMLTGEILKTIRTAAENGCAAENLQFLVPFNEGADADGQYARAIRTVLDRKGIKAAIVAPVLEHLPLTACDPDLLMRALAAGDLVYTRRETEREAFAAALGQLPDWSSLQAAAAGKAMEESAESPSALPLGAVGSCLTEISLNDGLLKALELEGRRVVRAPLSEELLFLWKDAPGNEKAAHRLELWERRLAALGECLGEENPWAGDFRRLFSDADRYLSDFSAANGRYRFAKALRFGEEGRVSAVLMLSPRYENTARILNMRKLHECCAAPVAELAPDGDQDGTLLERLHDFLFYLGKR